MRQTRQPRKRRRVHTCRGKRRFRDHAEAIAALRRLARSGRDILPGRAYECPACAGWHLTSKAER